MAVRRTKKQKQSAKVKRENTISYKFEDTYKIEEAEFDKPKKTHKIDQKQIKKLMVSSPEQVMKDLLKTTIVTVTVLIVLFVIYFVTEVK